MVQLLILWGYIFAMNACIGTGVLKILEKCISSPKMLQKRTWERKPPTRKLSPI